MQQFLLFCTMLIITSEAFSEELHESPIFKYTARKTRLVPKPECHIPGMFGHLKFPMFSVPFAHKLPDYKAPFFAPTRRRRFKQKYYHNGLNLRKRFRKKIFKQRKRNPSFSPFKSESFVLNSPQCFATSRLLDPGCSMGPTNNFTDFFNDINIENPNQFIVCFNPVLNQFKKRTLNPIRKRIFPPLKRQCSTDVNERVVKNKRSARTKSSFSEADEKEMAGSDNLHESFSKNHGNFDGNTCENHDENYDENLAFSQSDIASPVHYSLNRAEDENSPEKEKNKNVGSRHREENFNTEKAPLDAPFNVNLNTNEKLQDLESHFSSDSKSNLDVTELPLPSPIATVKYQNDVNFYEPQLRKEDDFTPPPFNTDLTNEADENFDEDETLPPYNITRLKNMLKDVESLLGKNDKANVRGLTEKGDTEKKTNKDTGDSDKKTSKETGSSVKKTNKETTGTLATTATPSHNASAIKKKIDTVALPVLQEISEELENISRLIAGKKPKKKKKFLTKLRNKFRSKAKAKEVEKEAEREQKLEHCSADGTWKSTVYGFELTFKTMPNMMLKVQVTSTPDSVISNKWSIHGLSLSKQGGPFMLGAVYPQKRKLASFLGQCKLCKNQQMIFGVWTIYTCGRRFTDVWRAVETKCDVLKKNS